MIALQLLNSLPFCSTPVFLPWIRESIVLQYIECLINIGNFFKDWWRQEKSDFSQLCVKRRLEAVRQDFESCFQSKGFYLQGQSHHQCQHKRSRDFNIVNHQHYRTNLVAMICTYWCLHYHPLVHTKRKYFLQQIKVRKPSKYNAQTDKCVNSFAKKTEDNKNIPTLQITSYRLIDMPPPAAPDGGFWAYMAVFGCFMGNVIGDGVMYRFPS